MLSSNQGVIKPSVGALELIKEVWVSQNQLEETAASQEVIRLGVLRASSSQLNQIGQLVAGFSKRRASVNAIDEIGLERFDIYLLIADVGIERDLTQDESEIGSLVVQAAFTPCLVLGVQDDEILVERALGVGAADFLALPTLDFSQLERAVYFALGRRRALDALSARETCLASARERDRQQLANNLHDGPLQDLIGARFLLGTLTSGGSVEDIQSSLQQVIQSVRSLCSELKPPALAPFGFEKAIRAHMQTFQTRHPDFAVTLELDVDRQPGTDKQLLPEWTRLALFRVFQAALSNVTKHANASHILVRMRIEGAQLRLTIADDGQGFELPSSWLDFARTERCGLLMMQERVDTMRGRMVVQSAPGSGTRVIVQVPVEQPSHPLPAYFAPVVPDPVVSDRNG